MSPAQLLLLVLLGVFAVSIHVMGVQTGKYDEHWWFDNVTHFTSGFVLTVYITHVISNWWPVMTVFLTLAFVWELFEYWYRNPESMWNSWRNMINDLVYGTVGAVAAFTVVVEVI